MLIRFKEFNSFCPCYFKSPPVKGIDILWKFWGFIGRFNDLYRQITSGVEKTADESMSAIRFCTTPKVDLPHYSPILRMTEPLGTEIKNVACYRLGIVLHLDIHKGEENMNTLTYQKQIRGTTEFMKRLMVATNECYQLTSNDTYFSDIWFSGVKTAEGAMVEGVDYCGPVNTSHKVFA